jgi:hypothetical protein
MTLAIQRLLIVVFLCMLIVAITYFAIDYWPIRQEIDVGVIENGMPYLVAKKVLWYNGAKEIDLSHSGMFFRAGNAIKDGEEPKVTTKPQASDSSFWYLRDGTGVWVCSVGPDTDGLVVTHIYTSDRGIGIWDKLKWLQGQREVERIALTTAPQSPAH